MGKSTTFRTPLHELSSLLRDQDALSLFPQIAWNEIANAQDHIDEPTQEIEEWLLHNYGIKLPISIKPIASVCALLCGEDQSAIADTLGVAVVIPIIDRLFDEGSQSHLDLELFVTQTSEHILASPSKSPLDSFPMYQRMVLDVLRRLSQFPLFGHMKPLIANHLAQLLESLLYQHRLDIFELESRPSVDEYLSHARHTTGFPLLCWSSVIIQNDRSAFDNDISTSQAIRVYADCIRIADDIGAATNPSEQNQRNLLSLLESSTSASEVENLATELLAERVTEGSRVAASASSDFVRRIALSGVYAAELCLGSGA